MKDYAEKKRPFDINVFDEIKNQKPEFFNLIYNNLPSLSGKVLADITFEELMKQGNKTILKKLVLDNSQLSSCFLEF
jgi:hypothetical protein